jgi:hypothetical protein
MKLRINHAGMRQILTSEAAPVAARIADRVAASAEALAGSVDGEPVQATRHDEIGRSRARSSVILTHPTDAGRRAGRDAATAAVQIAGEA